MLNRNIKNQTCFIPTTDYLQFDFVTFTLPPAGQLLLLLLSHQWLATRKPERLIHNNHI